MKTVRYVETDGVGSAIVYEDSGRGSSEWGTALSELPEWIHPIIATARVGGHLIKSHNPPPEYISWFKVDENNNLVRFENAS